MPEHDHEHRHGGRWDLAGGILSALCAIHCIALPVLLPFASLLVHSVWLEIGLTASAIIVGGYALRHGFQKHGFRLPSILFGIGMASILFGNWVLTEGRPLASHTPEEHSHSGASILFVGIGGTLILIAHVTNFVLERRWIREASQN